MLSTKKTVFFLVYFYTFSIIFFFFLEKAIAPHSSTLAWKIPWAEDPGGLQSGRVGHDWATSLSLFTFMHWRKKWQPTSVFLPGESQGRGSLVGCSPWGWKSRTRLSDFTFTFHFHALVKEMATHSSVLAWRIPGTGEPGGLLSTGSHRVGHNWSDLAVAADCKASVYNAGDPGSVPGLGRSPGEGNGNPLQYYYLENTMDRGAWSATVQGVAKSRTWLSDFTSLLHPSLRRPLIGLVYGSGRA